MIYDSQEQKAFIVKILLNYHCSHAESNNINKNLAPAIDSGVVIPVEKQQVFVDQVYPKDADALARAGQKAKDEADAPLKAV